MAVTEISDLFEPYVKVIAEQLHYCHSYDFHILVRSRHFENEGLQLPMANILNLIGWLFKRFTSLIVIFQPYRNLEVGDNRSMKLYQGDRESNSASQVLNHYNTAAPFNLIQSGV